ncbi:XRE family transcriptional regulator [Shewanella glacialimarina]|uniref:XRE family transcriptional regulator n=1 Tax=Shewanella glacialimarina TaxID=2590884 RepID=UPI001CF8772C|nr:helix-turn-helix transcriptional regulator [Shewanella glacialimarina]UCX03546.1 helix-turn-helix domain-containing protein [Shewanella glacialimarina]
MSLNQRVGQHIKHLRMKAGIKSQAMLAELCGWKSQSRVGNYEAGSRTVSPSDAEILAKVLGVDPAEIIFGYPQSNKRSDISEDEAVLNISGFEFWDSDTPLSDDEVEIPFYMEVELAAGHGISDVREYRGPKLRFAKSTLRKSSVESTRAACVRVNGNSMEPVLPNGSTVGVDTSQTNVIDGKMYAINHDGMMRIKTLYKLPGGGLRLRSFNTDEWPDERYEGDDLKQIKIIGKVFWYSVLL